MTSSNPDRPENSMAKNFPIRKKGYFTFLQIRSNWGYFYSSFKYLNTFHNVYYFKDGSNSLSMSEMYNYLQIKNDSYIWECQTLLDGTETKNL